MIYLLKINLSSLKLQARIYLKNFYSGRFTYVYRCMEMQHFCV